MAVKLSLTPEQETQLTDEARLNNVTAEDYLQILVQQIISRGQTAPVALSARPKYDRQAIVTLLDELETNHDKYGTPEEQRETLEYLKQVIDADRSGQRSIFGEGYNPE